MLRVPQEFMSEEGGTPAPNATRPPIAKWQWADQGTLLLNAAPILSDVPLDSFKSKGKQSGAVTPKRRN